jgi:F0F1-type ATP synthase membrane subunit b/b'
MKRGIRSILLLCFSGIFFVGFAQEGQESKKPETFAERYELELKWANFLILAGGLGYLVRKNAGPFFADRSRKIQEDIREAEAVRQDAERRAAEVDRRLAGLESEIAGLRADSQKEAEAESERMRQLLPLEIAKVRAHAEQEIAAAGKTARAELKQYAAEMAIGLAQQKLKARMTPDTQEALVRGFVRDVDGLPSPAPAQH